MRCELFNGSPWYSNVPLIPLPLFKVYGYFFACTYVCASCACLTLKEAKRAG